MSAEVDRGLRAAAPIDMVEAFEAVLCETLEAPIEELFHYNEEYPAALAAVLKAVVSMDGVAVKLADTEDDEQLEAVSEFLQFGYIAGMLTIIKWARTQAMRAQFPGLDEELTI